MPYGQNAQIADELKTLPAPLRNRLDEAFVSTRSSTTSVKVADGG